MVVPVAAMKLSGGRLVVVNATVNGDGGVDGAELSVRGEANVRGEAAWTATVRLDLQELQAVRAAVHAILDGQVRP